jgi:hypothetical protein
MVAHRRLYFDIERGDGMKIRIKGNSLRLRVSRSELARLLAGDCVEETIHFAAEASARFTYALQPEPSAKRPAVHYMDSRVSVLLPADQAYRWGVTDQVGIAAEISLGTFGTLALLIEKDFACLDRSDDDNQDTFANPNAGAAC